MGLPRWTQQERRVLRHNSGLGLTNKQIADLLPGRSEVAVQQKRYKLRLHRVSVDDILEFSDPDDGMTAPVAPMTASTDALATDGQTESFRRVGGWNDEDTKQLFALKKLGLRWVDMVPCFNNRDAASIMHRWKYVSARPSLRESLGIEADDDVVEVSPSSFTAINRHHNGDTGVHRSKRQRTEAEDVWDVDATGDTDHDPVLLHKPAAHVRAGENNRGQAKYKSPTVRVSVLIKKIQQAKKILALPPSSEKDEQLERKIRSLEHFSRDLPIIFNGRDTITCDWVAQCQKLVEAPGHAWIGFARVKKILTDWQALELEARTGADVDVGENTIELDSLLSAQRQFPRPSDGVTREGASTSISDLSHSHEQDGRCSISTSPAVREPETTVGLMGSAEAVTPNATQQKVSSMTEPVPDNAPVGTSAEVSGSLNALAVGNNTVKDPAGGRAINGQNTDAMYDQNELCLSDNSQPPRKVQIAEATPEMLLENMPQLLKDLEAHRLDLVTGRRTMPCFNKAFPYLRRFGQCLSDIFSLNNGSQKIKFVKEFGDFLSLDKHPAGDLKELHDRLMEILRGWHDLQVKHNLELERAESRPPDGVEEVSTQLHDAASHVSSGNDPKSISKTVEYGQGAAEPDNENDESAAPDVMDHGESQNCDESSAVQGASTQAKVAPCNDASQQLRATTDAVDPMAVTSDLALNGSPTRQEIIRQARERNATMRREREVRLAEIAELKQLKEEEAEMKRWIEQDQKDWNELV